MVRKLLKKVGKWILNATETKDAKCTKSLYRSTYKSNAFTKGRSYKITHENNMFYFMIDNKGREFDICKYKSDRFYYFDDYFNMIGDK